MIFHENRLLADDSHEISYIIFSKIKIDVTKLSSAAVLVGALRVKCMCFGLSLTCCEHLKQDQTLPWTCVAGANRQCVNSRYAEFK